ncbi:GNAT family N-acetyltransferase [Nonomuraea sp. NPDC050328]|uniref:GNAT family N-acetyltransferase n=1 Tax=Nonomuraea sp. NPDC050328 TaxID=3364361 RepID=UPI0037AE7B8D
MHSHTHAPSSTLRPPLTLRRAEPGDLSGVLTLLADTAEWLHSQGVRQWPRGGFGPERIEPLIGERVLHVLDADLGGLTAGPIACIALDGHADPEFWTPADRPADARYVHKLAVSRAWSGMGLGDALLDWAGATVGDAGLGWLRLDCAKDNAGLQRYYRRRGFTHLRTVDLPHRASGALFQRRAGGGDLFRQLGVRELVDA